CGRVAEGQVERRQIGVSEHGYVSDVLVDDVRLGGVEGLGVMTQVLRRQEASLSELLEEQARCDQAGDGREGEALERPEPSVHFGEARDVIVREAKTLAAVEV